MEKRDYEFLSKELNMNRVEEGIKYLASHLNFREICKVFREISYDQVCYYSSDSHSPIYDDKKRSKLNVEQCNRLQRNVSTAVDLYEQAISGREFSEDYLRSKGL